MHFLPKKLKLNSNKIMKFKILFFVFLSLSVLAQKPKLKKIFNGKNLKGWIIPDDKNCWTVENGLLKVESEPTKKGSILWTNTQYQNFIIQLDFKMGEGRVDSGIFLKSELNQIQIGISGSLKRDMTGSPYVIGKMYPKEATQVKDILKLQDWNTMKVSVIDKNYKVWLNGVEVMDYTTESIPETGPIGLQLHPGNQMSIFYKNILVSKL
jgi:hypothetical protein